MSMSGSSFGTTSVPQALYATVNTLIGLDEMLYCPNAHSFWGGHMHCVVPFAIAEMRTQYSSGTVGFGQSATFRVPKGGDHLYWTYLVAQIPGLKADDDQSSLLTCGQFKLFGESCVDINADKTHVGKQTLADYLCQYGMAPSISGFLFDTSNTGGDLNWTTAEGAYAAATNSRNLPSDLDDYAAYTNAVGFKLVREARFKVGSQTIVTLDSEYMFAQEEVGGRPGKRLEEMVGKRMGSVPEEILDELIIDSMQTRYLYIPLPFWFTKAPSHTLSLLHLHLSTPEIEVDFETLQNLVIRSREATCVKKYDGSPLQNTDLKCVLSTTHVWLPLVERERIQAQGTEKVQIIHQVQKYHSQLTTRVNNVRVTFNLPTLELLFFVRRGCRAANNDWFNFTGLAGLDAVDFASLVVNNNTMINRTEGSYFRLVKPFERHRLIPKSHIYTIPFALFPDEMLISGSLNFARYESIILNLELQHGFASTTEPADLFVYAPCYNSLLYRDGGCTLVFS